MGSSSKGLSEIQHQQVLAKRTGRRSNGLDVQERDPSHQRWLGAKVSRRFSP